MSYISPKKQRFVDFIRDFTHKNNRPPTFVEIMSGLNIKLLDKFLLIEEDLRAQHVR